MWRWGFKFSAELKRWIRVIAPVFAPEAKVKPELRTKQVETPRGTTASTDGVATDVVNGVVDTVHRATHTRHCRQRKSLSMRKYSLKPVKSLISNASRL